MPKGQYKRKKGLTRNRPTLKAIAAAEKLAIPVPIVAFEPIYAVSISVTPHGYVTHAIKTIEGKVVAWNTSEPDVRIIIMSNFRKLAGYIMSGQEHLLGHDHE